jgi:hypothetical protein
MVLSEVQWVFMGVYGSGWVLIGPYGSVRVPVGLYVFQLIFMWAQDWISVIHWVPKGPYG